MTGDNPVLAVCVTCADEYAALGVLRSAGAFPVGTKCQACAAPVMAAQATVQVTPAQREELRHTRERNGLAQLTLGRLKLEELRASFPSYPPRVGPETQIATKLIAALGGSCALYATDEQIERATDVARRILKHTKGW